MERRVAALEKGMERIEGKIDALIKTVNDAQVAATARFGSIDTKLASIEGQIGTRAPLSDLSRVEGAVSKLPTTLQLILFALAVIGAAGFLAIFKR